jgi:excisionase family DNA binding protein
VIEELRKPVDFGVNYQVSNHGRVYNLKTGKSLTGTINKDGYTVVYLTAGSRHKSFLVHVLVMRAFAGLCPDGQQVRHLDGNPVNNRWAPGNEEETKALGGNLIYGTPAENCKDRDEIHGRNGHANKTICGTCGLPYDEENTYISPSGSRCCRNCVRASGRRHDAKRANARNHRRREKRAAARDPEILTTGEAADLLEVSTETVRRWVAQGVLPFEQPGQHKRFRRSDVVKLAEQKRAA